MVQSNIYPFPGAALTSLDQFNDYTQSHQNLLDFRYWLEQSLASDKPVVTLGVCPLTRQKTRYISDIDGGEKRADGKYVPEWRHTQRCDNGLTMSERAVGHYATYGTDNGRLGDLLLIGGSTSLSTIMQNFSDSVAHMSLGDAMQSQASYDTVFVMSGLQNEPDYMATLTALLKRLKPEGRIYFYINFHYRDKQSTRQTVNGGAYWALGWDFIESLNHIGFKNMQAVTFWAQELGYLGPFNFLFEAQK